MKTLADLAVAQLHAPEEATLREAADSMLFCVDFAADREAGEALARAGRLRLRLEEAERISAETLDRLLFDIRACGPAAARVAEPAAVSAAGLL